jgi:tRNA (guanine-N7-)-methyltransferase
MKTRSHRSSNSARSGGGGGGSCRRRRRGCWPTCSPCTRSISGGRHRPRSPICSSRPYTPSGFGGAEHLIAQAKANPTVGLIGCEPFEEGVIKALGGIEAHGLDNVRVHPDDARDVLRWLPEASIDRAFVLFPDPWPKKKHQKRRLVNRQTLAALARVMKPGAELRIGTDIGDYVRSMMIEIAAEGSFAWLAARPDDWRVRPADWPETRYEQKAHREGRRCHYFQFRRRSASR